MKKLDLENFEILTINRSDIKEAKYNPRKIKRDNENRLRKNMDKVGLLQPLVWNKNTGNLVSGHQRLKKLDVRASELKYTDYQLTVAAVFLDSDTEKEQNIFFNNADAMGEWDTDALSKLVESGANLLNAGFSEEEISKTFGIDPKEFESEIDSFNEEEAEIETPLNSGGEKKEMEKKKEKEENGDSKITVYFSSQSERDLFLSGIHLENKTYHNSAVFVAALRNSRE